MKIIEHRLHSDDDKPCNFQESPNVAGVLKAEYLVMHYTAGQSPDAAVTWLTNPASNASAHLVIGRNGDITQLVPFNRIAWHAGASRWLDREGLNRYSIGIELDNAGRLQRHGNKWRAWFGRDYKDSEVFEGVHKNEIEPRGWHTYPTKQIEIALEISMLLVAEYQLLDIIGHDDISPGRKSDPGPAFPMQSFHGRVFGRRDDETAKYETKIKLPIREGPGTEFEAIGRRIPKGTKVEILDREGTWALIDVLETVNRTVDMQGWVLARHIGRIPAESQPDRPDTI